MSTSPKKRRFDDDDEPRSNSQSQGVLCAAHGCPLPGTLSDSTKGGPFHCWAHDRMKEAEKWGRLTLAINENRWLFKLAERVSGMPLIDFEQKQGEIAAYLKQHDRADLLRLTNTGSWPERCTMEPRMNWAYRLRNAAYNDAKTSIDSARKGYA